MPRVFTALEIPQDIAQELALLQGGVPGARWVDQENYHITLRFIGEASGRQLSDLLAMMAEVSFAPLELQLSGLGSFGSRKPRTIFARVKASAALERLQSAQERVCQQAGLQAEARKFVPHVTLARLRGASSADVNAFVASKNLFTSRPFVAERFVMLSSRSSHGGGPYALEEAYEATAIM